ncbi:hypothetical protein DZC72_14445 [Maribacter algicola]|uniref:Uncharacterized protein n=1 Tax=Maribacter algicola TaxID=2498892 RepID=A0A426RIT8_9FLAO|nr:hypothetical protein DZC72_14445 [Maribacter algicola]
MGFTPPRVRIPSSSAKETHDVSVVGIVFPNELQANLQKYLEAQNGQAKLAWVSCLHRIPFSACWDKIPSPYQNKNLLVLFFWLFTSVECTKGVLNFFIKQASRPF